MDLGSTTLESAVQAFSTLPGIGKKTAQRLVYYLIQAPDEEVMQFADAIRRLKTTIRMCRTCFNLTETDECSICRNPKRNPSIICVVAEPKDIVAIERTNEYRGLYHVLGGVISPLQNIGPDDLHIQELLHRLHGQKTTPIEELILAINASTEGDATMHYLVKICQPFVSKISRLARGIPIGGELEYIDEATIGRALSSRISF